MQFSQGSPAGTGNITFHRKVLFVRYLKNKTYIYINRKNDAILVLYLVIHVFFVLAPYNVLYLQLFQKFLQHLRKLNDTMQLNTIALELLTYK